MYDPSPCPVSQPVPGGIYLGYQLTAFIYDHSGEAYQCTIDANDNLIWQRQYFTTTINNLADRTGSRASSVARFLQLILTCPRFSRRFRFAA